MVSGAEAEKDDLTVPEPKVDPKDLIWRSKAPTMEYRRLGRTNFMVSRIVHGWGGDKTMWRRLVQRGVNYFDTARGYGEYETELKAFLPRNRDRVWVTSKSTGIAGFNRIDPEVRKMYFDAMYAFLSDGSGAELLEETKSDDARAKADLLPFHEAAIAKQKKTGDKPDLRPAGKRMAELYLKMLDESLGRLGIDHVDCYMMHGVEIPWFFDCIEVWEAYEKAHKAGKVKHFGFSTHTHVKEALAAGVEADKRGPWKIDVVMPAVNPGSFDDPSPRLNFKAELREMKKRDIGIIAMKTTGIGGRYPVHDWEGKSKALGDVAKMDDVALKKLWMLNFTGNLVDGVIAAMKNMDHFEQDLALPQIKLSAEAAQELRAIVKMSMAGRCHLCGDCSTVCPERIAVTDMIRYYAYVHQYDDKELARQLYAEAGYDPAKLCNNCGNCTDVCPSQVPIPAMLHELSADMA